MKYILTLLVTTLTLLANIGHLTALKGDAKVHHIDTSISPAKMGMPIQEGDKIITSVNTRAQIILKDDTVITIGSNSTFTFEKYLFNGGKTSTISMKSERGFFRSVTGKIGKIAPERFTVKTSSATIGIRGTDFSVLQTDKVERYVCYRGEIRVTRGDKSIDIDAGKILEFKNQHHKKMFNESQTPKLYDISDITKFSVPNFTQNPATDGFTTPGTTQPL